MVNSATRPPDKCLMVLMPVPDRPVVTRDGAALFTMSPSAHLGTTDVGTTKWVALRHFFRTSLGPSLAA